jgi:hypothetical protein
MLFTRTSFCGDELMPNTLQFEPGTETPSFAERHYSISEIAALWNLGRDAIRKLFENEPDILMIGASQSNRRKRRYVTLRVPAHVVERVHRRLSKV